MTAKVVAINGQARLDARIDRAVEKREGVNYVRCANWTVPGFCSAFLDGRSISALALIARIPREQAEDVIRWAWRDFGRRIERKRVSAKRRAAAK